MILMIKTQFYSFSDLIIYYYFYFAIICLHIHHTVIPQKKCKNKVISIKNNTVELNAKNNSKIFKCRIIELKHRKLIF